MNSGSWGKNEIYPPCTYIVTGDECRQGKGCGSATIVSDRRRWPCCVPMVSDSVTVTVTVTVSGRVPSSSVAIVDEKLLPSAPHFQALDTVRIEHGELHP